MTQPLIFQDKNKGGIIQIANVKGGVGKSTVATNLAMCLARQGRTLVIDLDGQGSAGSAFGIDPAEVTRTSFELLVKRFNPESIHQKPSANSNKISQFIKKEVRNVTGSQIRISEPISNMTLNIEENLDIIIGDEQLFRDYSLSHIKNLLFNIGVCQQDYKYVIVDTPSQWNKLIQELFVYVDLTLIPVTLNALVTRSLKNYLNNLKSLVQENTQVKIRIVKNEVYGKEDSRLVGKVKTMAQNREFLKTLVETVEYNSKGSRLYLPESIVFDVEIPESASIRNSQDTGKIIIEEKSKNRSQKAFLDLTQRVQHVLNQIPNHKGKDWDKNTRKFSHITRMAKVAVFLIAALWSHSLLKNVIPAPIVLGQFEKNQVDNIIYDGSDNIPLYRVGKYAIAQLRAVVPSNKQVETYVQEVIAAHNQKHPEEKQIYLGQSFPKDTELKFFPPTNIVNPNYSNLIPAYRYFMATVEDKYSYVTGIWAERGTGGSPKHQGIDVAAALGSNIISPVDGVAYVNNFKLAGRTVSIKVGNEILLFAHCNNRYVKNGEEVKKGQVIATVGMTGRTSGPHVHISYGIEFPIGTKIGKKRYKFTDPMLWFYKQAYNGPHS